jgi:hypothetical protein
MPASIIRGGDLVEVLRAPVVSDEYNREVRDWANATVFATGRGSIQHYLSIEEDTDRQTETEGARLFTDGTDLQGKVGPEDRIRYAGRVWEVSSPPQEWRFFGRYHHTEVFLRLVNG